MRRLRLRESDFPKLTQKVVENVKYKQVPGHLPLPLHKVGLGGKD
jgi:hypothetical protein